jgi:L-ascorbate metabolism protein UlaG (beta-lactamase superfamily)
MKITKYVHSCLFVQALNRSAIFDPGVMSEEVIDLADIKTLHDIFITHEHVDHFSLSLVKKLVDKFPKVRITSTATVVDILAQEGIKASVTAQEGAEFFNSPHEDIEPLAIRPLQIGVHYLSLITHPGDSHSFTETCPVLALPMTAPWGTTVRAINLALQLKPRFVIPIHDWHWTDEARAMAYKTFQRVLAEKSITFVRPENCQVFTIDVE